MMVIVKEWSPLIVTGRQLDGRSKFIENVSFSSCIVSSVIFTLNGATNSPLEIVTEVGIVTEVVGGVIRSPPPDPAMYRK